MLFFNANSVTEDKKVAVFFSVIRGKSYGFLWNLFTPDIPKDKTFLEIVTVLKSHFEPKSLIIKSV